MLCPICKNDKNSSYFDLLQCKICTHIFSKKIYDNAYWNDLYESKYTTIGRKSDPIRNEMYKQEIKWINNFKNLNGSFLDVGCSYGNFFSFLPPGMRKVGIDVSSNVINDAKKMHPDYQFYKAHIYEFDISDQFDFIQFRGVIQHVADPIRHLKSAIKLLKRDGIIIITSLPDFSSLASRMYKEKFTFYTTTLSPNFFTKKSFSYLLKYLGLKISRQQVPYLKTPYENFTKDLLHLVINKFMNKPNPPFYGNVRNYMIQVD